MELFVVYGNGYLRFRLAYGAWLAQCVKRRYHLFPVFLTTVMSGCVFEQAGLPDSSFSSLSFNQPPEKQSQPSPSAATTLRHKGAQSVSDAFDRDARLTTSSDNQASLAQSTDALLAQHQSAGSDSAHESDISAGNSLSTVRPNELSSREKTPIFSIEAVDAPVEALLFSLASDARLQLKVHGALAGRVTIVAPRQSLPDILASMAEQALFSWQLQAGTLSIWSGDRYSYSYTIDYLNISRRTQSSVGLATQVGTINASADSGSVANSSQTRVENTSEHRFWNSLSVDIQNMVSHTAVTSVVDQTQFSINREAGLLTVYALPEVHRNIQRYLNLLHDSSQRQVLIEATVVEVALSDSFNAGVDWQLLAKGMSGISAAQVLVGSPIVNAESAGRISAPSGLVSFVHEGGDGDVSATLSLLEQFGDVRILSKPRIIAMNNQSSVLKVVDNRVYFTVNVQRRQREDEDDEVVTETEIHTVPVGLVMNVTPQISAHGRVMLNVRPTLSRILGFVNDPNPELALASVNNGVPEIQVREMESMLQVQSGEVAIIGGLMQETQSENDASLPGLSALPGLGRLFSRKSRERRQTELLIVLRPTVIDSSMAEQ